MIMANLIRTLIDDLVELWEKTQARLDALVGPFFAENVTKGWFPVLFWAVMAPVLVLAVTGLLGHMHFKLAVLAILLGALFGYYLPGSQAFPAGERDRLEEAALKGDGEACRALGLQFLNGAPGIPRERELARKWFLAGAELGDKPSMVLLADLMSWGLGGLRDPEGAAHWSAKAHGRN